MLGLLLAPRALGLDVVDRHAAQERIRLLLERARHPDVVKPLSVIRVDDVLDAPHEPRGLPLRLSSRVSRAPTAGLNEGISASMLLYQGAHTHKQRSNTRV